MAGKLCSSCSSGVPSPSKRRRIFGPSSSLAQQAFREACTRLELENLLPKADRGAEGPFLCLPCFAQFDKIARTKVHLQQLMDSTDNTLIQTAQQQPNISGRN